MLSYQEVLALREEGAGSDAAAAMYALVDHGGMLGLVQQLNKTRASWVSLFEGSRDESVLSVAPLLILIDPDLATFRTQALLKWLSEHGAYASSIAFMKSPLPLRELARRLALRLDATLPDKMEILLRFFDSRILESLMAALSSSQKSSFLNVAHQWWYVDRAGKIISVQAEFSEAETSEVPLVLNEIQEGQLLDACEPDQIAASLLTYVPSEYQKLAPGSRHSFILDNLARARTFGVSSTYELSLYCSLALLYGIAFSEQEVWKAALEEVKAGRCSLEDVAMQLEQSNQLEG